VDEALLLADRVIVLGELDPTRPGHTVVAQHRVPPQRPRRVGDGRLLELRDDLLRALGVPATASTTGDAR
jgi:ABC-type nitrate/sulfonate/bicarbonate transport system ATPase subunit